MKRIDFFGPNAQFEHLGIAVRSIDRELSGAPITDDPGQKVRIQFINVNGLTIELIEPMGEDSPVRSILQNGVNTYHSCFRVASLEEAIKCAKGFGFRAISKPVEAPAIEDNWIVWLFHKRYGLFELVEGSIERGCGNTAG